MNRSDTLLALGFYAGFVLLLQAIPRWVAPDPAVSSAAAVQGYNTEAAYWTVLAWSLIGTLAFAVRSGLDLRARERPAETASEGAIASFTPAYPLPGRLRWGELILVFALFSAAYFPLFLARYGPYSEDQYFLTSLHRMHCGQQPYRDFAFLYGPLMIYPAWGWTRIFGVSMKSYYGLLAIVEGMQFAVLLGALQCFLPRRRDRLVAFLLLLPFLFDTLLGLNWNGVRRLVPALVALLVAWRPYDRVAWAWAAGLLGLHLSYSHEYALSGLFAVLGMYGVSLLRGEGTRTIRAASCILLGAGLVWLGVTGLLMGRQMPAYLGSMQEIVTMMSAGHAGFRFYWTANSLALFGLLTIACVAVGRGVLRDRSRALASGDRLLLCGLIYALSTLKSGLNRADLWHLNAPFLVLFFGFLLPMPAVALAFRDGGRRLALGLIVASSLTYLVGIAPSGSLYAEGYLRGLLDAISGRTGAPIERMTRTVSFEFERSAPRPHLVALGRFLAEPERASRPVFFYGRAWQLGPVVGVCREDYALDDLMYTERSRPGEAYLGAHPEALVVVRRADYERIFGLIDPEAEASPLTLTPTKMLGRWLSTVHYDAAETEWKLQNRLRDLTTGQYVRARYEVAAEFDGFVVLQPKETPTAVMPSAAK